MPTLNVVHSAPDLKSALLKKKNRDRKYGSQVSSATSGLGEKCC